MWMAYWFWEYPETQFSVFKLLSWRAKHESLNKHISSVSKNLPWMPVVENTAAPWGISCIFSPPQHTVEFGGLWFRAYPKISAWKSSFCPGRPMLNWVLTSGDCVTAGNFWFCFAHKSRRITSSETHLTRLLLLYCPLLNPYCGLHLPARWEIRQSRDSPPYCTESCVRVRDNEWVNMTSCISLLL